MCGLAVDWLRSCYRSQWRLYRDHDTLTPGRYYFTPDDVPFYDGWHHLGSANWEDKNWQVGGDLGEVRTFAQWDNGSLPAVLPKSSHVGSKECIANGETIEDTVPLGSLIDGWVPDCVLSDTSLDVAFKEVSNYNACILQRFYCYIIDCLSGKRFQEVEVAFAQFMTVDYNITIHDSAALQPAFVTVTTPNWSIVVTNGTEDNFQLALEAVSLNSPAVDFGIGKTIQLWWMSSTVVHEALVADGMVAGTPIMLAGYSWGAALIGLLAARYRFADENRLIRWIMFGAPKPGDQRIRDLLDRTDGISIVTTGDVVSIMPPDLLTLAPIAALYPLASRLIWTDFVRAPNQRLLDADGTMELNTPFVTDTEQIKNILDQAIANEEIDVTIYHRLPSYVNRLKLACPCCVWPLPETLCEAIVLGGADCEVALPIARGQSYERFIGNAEVQWYVLPIVEGEEYTIRITQLSGVQWFISVPIFVGETCSDQIFFRGLTQAAPSSTWIAPAMPFAWIAVNANDPVGDSTYLIEVLPNDEANMAFSPIVLEDRQPTNTPGGTSTSPVVNTRVLNTKRSDPTGICTLVGNAFSLPKGFYHLIARAPAYNAGMNRLYLHEATNGILEIGPAVFSQTTSITLAILECNFLAEASDSFTIMHKITTAQATNGLGVQQNDGLDEVYCTVVITPIAFLP